MSFDPPINTLDFHITDVCSLTCRWCSQGVPTLAKKEVMTLARLKELLPLFEGMPLQGIHVSGGEPTANAEFGEISTLLAQTFKVQRFVLYTNGYRLDKFTNALKEYTCVELSHYPRLNDSVRLQSWPLPKVRITTKRDGLLDVKRARGRHDAWKTCPYSRWVKVTASRIWRCCEAKGICVIRDLDENQVSVKAEPGWQDGFQKLNLSAACCMCPFH